MEGYIIPVVKQIPGGGEWFEERLKIRKKVDPIILFSNFNHHHPSK